METTAASCPAAAEGGLMAPLIIPSTTKNTAITTTIIPSFQRILEEFNRQGIQYCVLRNYEFLLDPRQDPGKDFDLTIAGKDIPRADALLRQQGFIKYPPKFSRQHQGYGKYFPDEELKLGFDVQNDGIYWNDLPYLRASQLMPRRKKKGFFFVLSDEDSFLMYLCHSLLGKRHFKEKYREELVRLSMKHLDWGYITRNLSAIFNRHIALSMINAVHQGDFTSLQRRAYWYAFFYVFHTPRNILPFTLLFFRWLRWLRLGHSYPLISFIGPDGSGKSSNAEHLAMVLRKNQRNADVVYIGRGKKNILPLKKLARKYKEHEQKARGQQPLLQPLVYTAAAPFYVFDLLLRYFFIILPKRKRKHIVITDRYGSDILLMRHVPSWLRTFLLAFFPRPTLTFYLFNDTSVLYQRRKQQSLQELERQMRLFSSLAEKFNAHWIKTTRFEDDAARIVSITFDYLMRNRY